MNDFMLKAGDIIEITMSIDLVGFDEDPDRESFHDYARNYNISYYLNGEFHSDISFDIEEGLIFTFNDDIEDYIKESFATDMKVDAEYEVFDVYSKEYGYQKAKIRIKSLK